jgi:hypothetical protein
MKDSPSAGGNEFRRWTASSSNRAPASENEEWDAPVSDLWKTAEKMRARNQNPTRRFLGSRRFEALRQIEREEDYKFSKRLQWDHKIWQNVPKSPVGSSWQGLEEAVWRLSKI